MFWHKREQEQEQEQRLTIRLARVGFLQELLDEQQLPDTMRAAYADELVALRAEVNESIKTAAKTAIKVVGVVTVCVVIGGVAAYVLRVSDDEAEEDVAEGSEDVIVIDAAEIIIT